MKLFSFLPAVVLVFMASPFISPGLSAAGTSIEPASTTTETSTETMVESGRKIRIQKLLWALDLIAEETLSMREENIERLEPVIVELAEQTLSLAGESEIQNVKTDTELERLEVTVSALARAVGRMIEPELNL